MISGQCTETHRRVSHESSESDCSQRHYIAAARNSARSAAIGNDSKGGDNDSIDDTTTVTGPRFQPQRAPQGRRRV